MLKYYDVEVLYMSTISDSRAWESIFGVVPLYMSPQSFGEVLYEYDKNDSRAWKRNVGADK
jgi:hypothetical protein